jgi:hypothetical protein
VTSAPSWLVVVGVVVLLAGALLAAVLLARARTARTPARIRARDGRTMMEVTSVGVAGGQLVVKGSFMGAMPATTLVRPEEAWRLVGLVGIRVVVAMPAFLLVGWWRCVRPRTTAAGPSSRGAQV